MIELHVAIIIASLPPCRALALQLYRRVREQNPHGNSGNEVILPSKEIGQRSTKRGLSALSKCTREEVWIQIDP